MAGGPERATEKMTSGRGHSAAAGSAVNSDDFPEQAAAHVAILASRDAKARLLEATVADGWTTLASGVPSGSVFWAPGKTGWLQLSDLRRKLDSGERARHKTPGLPSSGFFDPALSSNALACAELEASLQGYGGRDHGQTVSKLISLGARRSAGVLDLPTPGGGEFPRSLEDRLHIAPQGRGASSAAELQTEPSSRPPRSKNNPFRQPAGGKLRRERKERAASFAGRHARQGDETDGTGPLGRLAKLPQSPSSPVPASLPRGASPLQQDAHKRAHIPKGSDGFAKRAPRSAPGKGLTRDKALSGLLQTASADIDAWGQAKRTRMASAGSQKARGDSPNGSNSGSPSQRGPAQRTRNPLSPLLAARALTSPHLLPMRNVGGRRASGHKVLQSGTMHPTWKKEDEDSFDPLVLEGSQQQGWREQVARLRSIITEGKSCNWKIKSPATNLERTILAHSKWRMEEAELDHHDKVVISGMPYRASNVINQPEALRALGLAMLNPDPLVRTAGLAALGNKHNYGNPSCLAQIVPRLEDTDPGVKAAALRGIEQIAKPDDERQFMEVEIEVFGAKNLPKKDRFGACDGYVILTLKHPGESDVEIGRTAIKWQDLNPRWRQRFYCEVKDPAVDEIGFSVWDEDGQVDDICGVCSLKVKDIDFDEATGAKPQMSASIQILDINTTEAIRGWDAVALRNTGAPSKLLINARYSAYIRPRDLVNQFIELLSETSLETRRDALKCLAAYYTDGNTLILKHVASMLEDEEDSIRLQASLILQELAGVDDDYVVQMVARRLDHVDPRIRHTAVQTLPRIATKGNIIAIQEVARRLESPEAVIRALVSETMPNVTEVGDQAALKEITRRFKHKREEVRQAAIFAFTTIAPVGDHDAISVIEPMMEDEAPSCRQAAVEALKRVSNVGAMGDKTVMDRARIIFQKRIDLNHGAGEPNRVILDSVKKALTCLNVKAPSIFACDPATEGGFNALIPASWLRVSREHGVFTEPVDPMPIDTKFGTSLPYRPPTPPWEPKAMKKASLSKTIQKCKEEIAIASNGLAQLEEEAEERELSTAEEMEVDELNKKIEQRTAQLEMSEAELAELVGDVEVQPPNTTKLGFTTGLKVGVGEHCSWHKCQRSACF